MAIMLTGRVVFIREKQAKESQKTYQEIQLLQEGNGRRARLENVRDMRNLKIEFGQEVSLNVEYEVYTNKNGVPGLSWTHWGKAVTDGVAEGVLGPEPPPLGDKAKGGKYV
jgi:hypothetical protein